MSPMKPLVSPLAGALALALTLPAAADPVTDAASATDLDKVVVEGPQIDEVTSPKFTQPLLDTPQTVTIVPAELMQEQGVTTLRDALRNVPGISMQAGEGGIPAGDNLSLRGFSARTDLFVDGIRDFGGYSRDPFNLEQIEVVKGPASAQTGRGSTGGSINLASKTARLDAFNRAGVSVGDDSLVRVTGDFNHALGEHAAFRVNVMGHEGQVNGRDHVENQRWGIAPTLAFGLGTDTSVHFSLFHLEQDNVPDYGLPWVTGMHNLLPRNGEAPVDRANWYGILARDHEQTRTDMATVAIEHVVSDALKIENTTRWGAATRDSVVTAPRFASNNSTAITRAAPKTRDSRDSIVANMTNLSASFSTGQVRHDLVAGVELGFEKSKNRARVEDPAIAAVSPTSTTDLFNPNPHGSYVPLVRDPLGTVMAEADSAAAYLFDTLTLSEHWELSAGLRWDRFDVEALSFDKPGNAWVTRTRNDSEVSGRIGAVFKPVEHGSIYVGYGTSFNPSAEGLSLSAALVDVEPEESRTLELGTKWNLLDNHLTLTSAVFRTEKTNARTPDPVDPSKTVLTGEQRVDGFEIGVAGRITRNWTVSGGYAWLEGEVTRSTDVREAGKSLGNTPRHSASLWTTYAFTDALEAGLGVQHVGERWTNNREERTTTAYTLADAMVSYRFNDALALRLNGYNLTNKAYIDRLGGGHYVPGAERTFMLSADFSF